MGEIYLKPGREKSVLHRHPWIFSGAIARLHGDAGVGDTVQVYDSEGNFLAQGAYSPHSQIQVRIWTWEREETVGPEFFRKRLQRALELRQEWGVLNFDESLAHQPGGSGKRRQIVTEACRLVHGESDGLPGLIVDRYKDILVMQCLSAGTERWREVLADALLNLIPAESVYERSDVDVRALEGLPLRIGCVRGPEPAELVQIREGDLKYWVDVRHGHKTGFYLDQRANRAFVGELAQGREVLDCFSYTGGFALSALVGGATSVLAVEASAEALALARKNLALNSLPTERIAWQEGDVFQVLRQLRDRGRGFDLIVLDPPKFAATAAQAQRAARGYKDINLLAFKLLRPGGLLVTFSCSGGVSEELFQKIVAGAALDAGVEARIVRRLHQDVDHPVALNFPEGAYLKGLVIKV